MADNQPQHADYALCPGSHSQFDPRPERLGYWLPCPICGRDLLPRFGGIVPEHFVWAST